VQFNPEVGTVDMKPFVRALQGDLAVQSVTELEAAVSLYRGDFLAGMELPDAPEFEFWLLGERARLRHLYERGLQHLVMRLVEDNAFEAATEWAKRLVQTNPLLEDAHNQLIWLYAHAGQQRIALEHLEKSRLFLHRQLRVEPTPELQTLHKALLSGRLASFPVLRQSALIDKKEKILAP
jgi:DNA-binding SARP family transcriptional activator